MKNERTLIINTQSNEVVIQETKPKIKDELNGFMSCTFDTSILYINKIDTALGDIRGEIENKFPPDQYFGNEAQFIYDSCLNDTGTVNIAGFSVKSLVVPTIYNIFRYEEDALNKLTLESLEQIRIAYGIKGTLSNPFDTSDYTAGSIFVVKDIVDVIYSLLYFYAFNHLKQKKCDHCGKWFSTDTLKTKYCSRKSPMEQYSHLKCRRAAEDCRKKLRERETAIYDNWKQNLIKYGDRIDDLRNTCNKYLKILSVENLQALTDYLYADDKPKQTRPNRKKKEIGD